MTDSHAIEFDFGVPEFCTSWRISYARHLRAATCIELAANIVIRRKLVDDAHLPLIFVDSLLMLANGLRNKIQKLIQPMYKGTAHEKALAALAKEILKINNNRNRIVHSGQFRGKKAAEETVSKTEQTIREMLRICQVGTSFPTLEDALTNRLSWSS